MVMACSDDATLRDGDLARVQDTVFREQDVAAELAQLDAFGQLRFQGAEGARVLLLSLVDAELMAQAAESAGYGRDPRVTFAIAEEVAEVAWSSEMERRVPRGPIADDVEQLRAYYDDHPEQFVVPEQRSLRAVMFTKFGNAVPAHHALMSGDASLETLGEVVTTSLQAQDNREYPGLHPFLFDPKLKPGDVLSVPVWSGRWVLVAELHELKPAHRRPFSSPEVQEQLVEAIRGPRVDAAERRWLDELHSKGL